MLKQLLSPSPPPCETPPKSAICYVCNTRPELRNKCLLPGCDFKSPNSGGETMCLFPKLKYTHLLELCLYFRGDHSQASASIIFSTFASALYLLLLTENTSRLMNACEKKPSVIFNFHPALMAQQPRFPLFSLGTWAVGFSGPYPWQKLKQDGVCWLCST